MKKADIEDKIISVINRYDMVAPGDTVIIAVSGGADSMCLLSFFNEYSRKKKFNIIAAHVNHGIRGKEAERDENFVKKFCMEKKINLRIAHFNVPETAKETGESEELCGRRLRYSFFNSIADNAKIATAHNLNDSMETFLFNFSRGTGLKGLTGIPAVRENIIRPLIECTREEIEMYLKICGVSYVTDSTNLCDEYSRNKIRHNIIPVLFSLNPSFASVFGNCISSLRSDEQFLELQTEKAFNRAKNGDEFSAEIIASLDVAVRGRVLLKIARYYGGRDAEFRHIELLNEILNKSGAVNLPGNVTVESSNGYLRKKLISAEKQTVNDISIKFELNQNIYSINEFEINFQSVDKTAINLYNIKKLSLLGYIDADKLKNSVFRFRKDGDRYKYPFSSHSKTLKNLFREHNISSEARNNILILADSENILWIDGIGTSDYAKVTNKSENIIKINVLKNKK